MKRTAFALFAPPLAVCRYGGAGLCAAPIGVFWIAGIAAIVYGLFGGTGTTAGIAAGVSWGTVALGVALWAIAAAWAETTLKGVEADRADRNCERNLSTMCRLIRPQSEEDPFEQVRKYRP